MVLVATPGESVSVIISQEGKHTLSTKIPDVNCTVKALLPTAPAPSTAATTTSTTDTHAKGNKTNKDEIAKRRV